MSAVGVRSSERNREAFLWSMETRQDDGGVVVEMEATEDQEGQIMSDEYMCPFCVKPGKCNGPHIESEDMANFESYARSQYNLGFRNALAAALGAVDAISAPYKMKGQFELYDSRLQRRL